MFISLFVIIIAMNMEIENLKKYVRATNYLSVSQIYLKNNFLLKDKLSFDDIKPRLLGHWGTCPGINFVYAHLNNLIIKKNANIIFLLGPGHGFPALQSNVFLEGTLGKYYSKATKDENGIGYISRNFSWPYGFPSHSSPATPGVILEGGELGYSLSTSFGAVLDKPDLIAVTLVGDGEAETGPTATAWHLSKFLNPATDGAVLPILHLNGYKISGPTIMGRMTNKDLKSLFSGYGYEPYIVEGNNDKVYEKMVETLDKCYEQIREVQAAAKAGEKIDEYPRWPMIVLRTPKGWTGIKTLKGEKMEGNCLSHQVVGKEAKTDKEELKALEKWMKSYKFDELYSAENGWDRDIISLIPDENKRMADNQATFGLRDESKNLLLPEINKLMDRVNNPGSQAQMVSAMRKIGSYFTEIFKLNKDRKNFRLMSPDETYSNRLDEVFKETARAWSGKIEEWDKDLARGGRVMEMLSEHSLQGLLQGYVLTGRFGVFASYEAFIQIVSSMADQYAKFLKIAREIPWRGDLPSFNYILTSSGWRQEHNGFSHQNPGFMDSLLQKHNNFISVFFPPDANTAVAVMESCLKSRNEINVIVAEKTPEVMWLSPELAEKELAKGVMTWNFASDENPDIVFSAAGQYLTNETLAAVDLLKQELPKVNVRFVNILEVSANTLGSSKTKLSQTEFESYFTADKPVIFNFHGYPETLKQAIFDYQNQLGRFSVHGYMERGSTTTPFDLHLRNRTSRYDLLLEAFEKLLANGVIDKDRADFLKTKYRTKIIDAIAYAIENAMIKLIVCNKTGLFAK
jgi:xylulose-5-phosphate/fructose-6-phosphate phosphoketolase